LKKKISFIINPLSGDIQKRDYPEMIRRILDPSRFEVEIQFTGSEKDNWLLAEQAVRDKRDVVIAVGGDGTINHVAKHVTGTDILFGIIPCGSGNGLARHLKIPLDAGEALKIINGLHHIRIDTGTANDAFFINAAGVGFDAHVTHMFAHAPRRGLLSYVKIVLKEFRSYKPRTYQLTVDGKTMKEEAFVLCVANGSQYGNNAWIAPSADLEDGIFEGTVIKPFILAHMPVIVLHLFRKKFGNSKYVNTFRGRDILVKRLEKEVVNIDGEPVMMEADVRFRIRPSSLNMIVPRKVEGKTA
jgi:YegS/Rv2252/BmrU family lipid kinase